MLIRHANPARDAAGCLEVYAPFVEHSAVSFEDVAPSVQEYARRIRRLNKTHAFLVADDGRRIAGFAYAGPYRERTAYRWSCEATVYLHPEYHRHGLGRMLYTTLFGLLQAQGFRTVLSAIAMPNDASIGLHQALGFQHVGTFRRSGWKDGAWRDVAWLQLLLGEQPSDATEPRSPGAPVRLPAPIPLDV